VALTRDGYVLCLLSTIVRQAASDELFFTR